MSTPPRPNLRAVFQGKDFRKLWFAQFVSIFGDFLALFGRLVKKVVRRAEVKITVIVSGFQACS